MVWRLNAVPLLVYCYCPDEVAAERMIERSGKDASTSEGRPDLLARQRDEEEPIPEDLPYIRIDTTISIRAQIDQVLGRLREYH